MALSAVTHESLLQTSGAVPVTPGPVPARLPIDDIMNRTANGSYAGLLNSRFRTPDPYPAQAYGPFVPAVSEPFGSVYTSPDRGHSPQSEPYRRFRDSSISSQSTNTDWTEAWPPAPELGGLMPPNLGDGAAGYDPVGISRFPPNRLLRVDAETDQTALGPAAALPFSFSDAGDWAVLRSQPSIGPGFTSNAHGTGIFDPVRWQNCLNCYWQFFHPVFPIVHHPTFFSTSPSPLLSAAMVAIGSQYDSRVDAPQYSRVLLETAMDLLMRRRERITTRSRLADLQTIALLEILSTWRSRRADVLPSTRFRSLYANLDQARLPASTNPLAIFRELGPRPSSDELRKAQRFWIEHESRRRVLQASIVLDTQRSVLFEQTPALPRRVLKLRTVDLGAGAGTGTAAGPGPAFPCDEELWESSPVERWAEHAARYEYLDLGRAAERATEPGAPQQADSFQCRVFLSHALILPDGDPVRAALLLAFHQSVPGIDSARGVHTGHHGGGNGNGNSRRLSNVEFDHDAFLVAQHTPIQALLTVSGESWLFGRKVESEARFVEARQRLRGWVDGGDDCLVALWHASRLLRGLVLPADDGVSSLPSSTTTRSSSAAGVRGRTTRPCRLRDTHMLHEAWCIYLAVLVCWACGFRGSVPLATLSRCECACPPSQTHGVGNGLICPPPPPPLPGSAPSPSPSAHPRPRKRARTTPGTTTSTTPNSTSVSTPTPVSACSSLSSSLSSSPPLTSTLIPNSTFDPLHAHASTSASASSGSSATRSRKTYLLDPFVAEESMLTYLHATHVACPADLLPLFLSPSQSPSHSSGRGPVGSILADTTGLIETMRVRKVAPIASSASHMPSLPHLSAPPCRSSSSASPSARAGSVNCGESSGGGGLVTDAADVLYRIVEGTRGAGYCYF